MNADVFQSLFDLSFQDNVCSITFAITAGLI